MKLLDRFLWGNICEVGASADTIEGHHFKWKEGDTHMECSVCGWRWDGMGRWFGGMCIIKYCWFENATLQALISYDEIPSLNVIPRPVMIRTKHEI